MAAFGRPSIFIGVDFHSKSNKPQHHTEEILGERLIVRRGQPFTVTIQLVEPFNAHLYPLTLTAGTGTLPSEDLGTLSRFGIPDTVTRSPLAKAVWKVELQRSSFPQKGFLTLEMTPPADAPIGEYNLSANYKNEDKPLGSLVVLFNPWCPDDRVFLSDERKKQEYVLNEHGVIFRGTPNYIGFLKWDFGQFEEDMVDICLKILDMSRKHLADPAEDVSARSDPGYVGRVVSAMINSEGDHGVLEGNWGESYAGGLSPSHWSGSHDILNKWYTTECRPVKYGQCWVFAGVMCSVMRLLGIPCRVITNFASAHDCNANLTIDVFFDTDGSIHYKTQDSVWNFHVWVEGWMTRPDLPEAHKYNGWQVLDPTPQELSGGVFCCGPSSVKAILNGKTHLRYDTPFVFAEVNADIVNWQIQADGSKKKMTSNTRQVGQNISTKSVGPDKYTRRDITNTYKHEEGSKKERETFVHATTRDYSKADEDEETDREESEVEEEEEGSGNETPDETSTDPPPLSMQFKEETQPINGQDVSMWLVLKSMSSDAMLLSITISVQGIKHTGRPVGTIQTNEKEATLQPNEDLSIPILVPYSVYHKIMLESESMKIVAVVTDKDHLDKTYLGEDNIMLLDPPVSVKVFGETRVGRQIPVEVSFMNPLQVMLKDCTLTLSGSGLFAQEFDIDLPNLRPSNRLRIKFGLTPYRRGLKTIAADISCSEFKDIKGSCSFTVTF